MSPASRVFQLFTTCGTYPRMEKVIATSPIIVASSILTPPFDSGPGIGLVFFSIRHITPSEGNSQKLEMKSYLTLTQVFERFRIRNAENEEVREKLTDSVRLNSSSNLQNLVFCYDYKSYQRSHPPQHLSFSVLTNHANPVCTIIFRENPFQNTNSICVL